MSRYRPPARRPRPVSRVCVRPAPDDKRGTGRTTQQVLDAPPGAYMVTANVVHLLALLDHLNRRDITVRHMSWMDGEGWRGLPRWIILDHALMYADADLALQVAAQNGRF